MKRLDQSVRFTEMAGERIAVVDTAIPDDAPSIVREGLARRAIVNSGGVCPCGVRFVMPSRAMRRQAECEGRAIEITIEHEDGCPAATELLFAEARRWAGGR